MLSLAVGERSRAGVLPEDLVEVADGGIFQSRSNVCDAEIRVVQEILGTLNLDLVDHMDVGGATLSGEVAGEVIIAHVHEVSGLSGSHFLFRIAQNVLEKSLEFAVHGGFPVNIIELHLIFLNEKSDQAEDIGALLKTDPGREIIRGDVTVRMLLRKLGGGQIGYHRIQNFLQERSFWNREITVFRQIAGGKGNGNHLGKM